MGSTDTQFLEKLDEYKFGFQDPDTSVFKSSKGFEPGGRSGNIRHEGRACNGCWISA